MNDLPAALRRVEQAVDALRSATEAARVAELAFRNATHVRARALGELADAEMAVAKFTAAARGRTP